MHCPKCQHDNPDAARFCNQCGAALAAPTAPQFKRLTVLFSDLVGSVEIASQLDPEDWLALLGDYQAAAGEAVTAQQGHVAQHLGDGLVAYFGYPEAGEDDAARAVRAGLELVAGVQRLKLPPRVPRLRVRVGLHTGPVVMGEVGTGPQRETLALGDTPNIAARLQALAPANGVVVSPATYSAVRAHYHGLELGEQVLKGLALPMRLHQIVAARQAEGEDDPTRPARLPLVGRQHEIDRLLQAWDAARGGAGGNLLLQGEPGIGKSRLARELRAVATHDGALVWQLRCSVHQRNTPFAPMVALLSRVVGDDATQPHHERAAHLEALLERYGMADAATRVPLAALLGIQLPAEQQAPPLSAAALRERTFEAATSLLLTGTARQPGLLIAEDLHWADPSTLQWLARLVERPAQGGLLLLMTARSEFRPPWTPTPTLVLEPCPPEVAAAMVRALDSRELLSDEAVARIEARAEGNPLFVEEFTRAALEAGGEEVPASLQQQTQARIDRLGEAKAVLQQASVIGRQFSRALLQSVCALDAETVAAALQRGVEAQLLRRVRAEALPGAQAAATEDEHYAFRHALLQDAAYASLLRSARQASHGRVAQALLAADPQAGEQMPEVLAHHFAEGGQPVAAMAHGLRAGQLALARSACLEAAAHAQRALALLPQAPSDSTELELQLVRAPALMAVHGVLHPDVERAYQRARMLCDRIGSTPKLLVPLWGLWAWELMRGRVGEAHDVARQIGALARQVPQPMPTLVAVATTGMSLFYAGRLSEARDPLSQGVALYRPPTQAVRTVRGVHDPGAMCHAFDMLARWMLGDTEGATAGAARLRAMIPALAPYDAAFSGCADALLAALEGDIERCGAAAARAAAVAEEQAFNAWEMMAAVLRGYSRALGHQPERGLAQMQRALEAWVATGAHNLRPLFLGLLAEAWVAQGQAGPALAAAQSGLEAMAGGERCWVPLLLGARAEALALQGHAAAAQADRDEAVLAAQAMGASGWVQRLRTPPRSAARGRLNGRETWSPDHASEGRGADRTETRGEDRSEDRSEGQSA